MDNFDWSATGFRNKKDAHTMKGLTIFLYEWKHFVRSPFKIVATVLFVFAGMYGLHNGEKLYQEQMGVIATISEKSQEQINKHTLFFDQENPSPENRPWVNLSMPDWAIWYTRTYHFKTPSPAIVYSIGQAEQYGFYKRVNYMSSPYDTDMTKEIANPERLQTGTIDFAFALIFLLPLLLIILLYNLKSMEHEQGFLPLIEVQIATKNIWLMSKVLFYFVFIYLVIVGLLFYGALLTDVFASSGSIFGEMLFYSLLYLVFWTIIFFLLIRKGSGIMENTLKMVGIWLIATFIIPAAVHQWISIEKPANLMTDFIDASRDKKEALYDEDDSVLKARLSALFPEIENSALFMDNSRNKHAFQESKLALLNELKKENIALIEAENTMKNTMVQNSYPFNLISFFQNRFNKVAKTHYNDYQNYRNEIKYLVDIQLETMVVDLWNDTKVDKERFTEYHEIFSSKNLNQN